MWRRCGYGCINADGLNSSASVRGAMGARCDGCASETLRLNFPQEHIYTYSTPYMGR